MRSTGKAFLVVSPWLPYPPRQWGAATRSHQILTALARRGAVTLLAFARPEDSDKARALRELGIEVRTVPAPTDPVNKRLAQLRSIPMPSSFEVSQHRSPSMQDALILAVTECRPQAILVEFSQMAAPLTFPADLPLFVDEHNIEYELHRRLAGIESGITRRAFNWLEYVKLQREEERVWRRSDLCIVTSAREEQIVRQAVSSTATAVVPNGVDIGYFTAGGGSIDPDSIVFTGRMDYRPNADAAIHFATEVLPLVHQRRPAAVFHIVGQDPPAAVLELAGPRVEVTGKVPDVRPYLGAAAVVVVPVRAGSGTRLKILEALAAGKGLVSTSLGCEGLSLEPGSDLLVGDGAAAFANLTNQLLEDPARAAELGRRGRETVSRLYSWPEAIRNLDAAIDSLFERQAGSVTD